MTDGDGLTYRVLLRSGGFSDTVCAKQVCILKTPQREKANKHRLTYFSGSGVSTDRRMLPVYLFFPPSLCGSKFGTPFWKRQGCSHSYCLTVAKCK